MEGRWREKMGGEGGGGGGGGGGGVVGGSSPVGGQVVVDHQRHLLHVDACPAPPPHAPPSRRAPSRPQTGPPQPHGGGRGSRASPLLPTSACHADDRAARADKRAAALQCTQDRARDRRQAPPKPGGRARTAGEQVGGDEDAGGAAAELAHDELAALLVHVAVLPPTPTTPKHTHKTPGTNRVQRRPSAQHADSWLRRRLGWVCGGSPLAQARPAQPTHSSGFCLRSLDGRGCAPASEAERGTDFRCQGARNERARGWRGREGLRDDAGRSQGLRPASRSRGGAGADQGRHGEVARRHLVQQEVHLPPRVDVDDGLPRTHHQNPHRSMTKPPTDNSKKYHPVSQPPTSKHHHRPHSHPSTTANTTTHLKDTPATTSNTATLRTTHSPAPPARPLPSPSSDLGNGEGLVEIAQRLQLPVLPLDSDVELPPTKASVAHNAPSARAADAAARAAGHCMRYRGAAARKRRCGRRCDYLGFANANAEGGGLQCSAASAARASQSGAKCFRHKPRPNPAGPVATNAERSAGRRSPAPLGRAGTCLIPSSVSSSFFTRILRGRRRRRAPTSERT